MLDTISKFNIQITFNRINALAKLLRKFQNCGICIAENVIGIQITAFFCYFVTCWRNCKPPK